MELESYSSTCVGFVATISSCAYVVFTLMDSSGVGLMDSSGVEYACVLDFLLRFLLAPTKDTGEGIINDRVAALMDSSGVDLMDSSNIEYDSLMENNNNVFLTGNSNKLSSGEMNDVLVDISTGCYEGG